jgi:hypothetical protein
MLTALEETEFFSVSSHTEAPNANEKVLSVTVFWINENQQEQTHIVHFFNFRLSTNFKLLENLLNEFESSVVWYDAPRSAAELTQITYSTVKINSLKPRAFEVLKKYTFFANGDVLLQEPRLFAQRNESDSGIKEYHGSVMQRDCPHRRGDGESRSSNDDDDDDDDTKSDETVAKELKDPQQKPEEMADIKAPHHGGDDSRHHGGDDSRHHGGDNSRHHGGDDSRHHGGRDSSNHHKRPQKRHYQNGENGENGDRSRHHSSQNGGEYHHRWNNNNNHNGAALLKPVGEHNPVMKIAESIVENKLVQTLDDEYGVPKSVGDLAHVIGIVWNSTISSQIEYKLIFVYNREEVPETLMSLEREIKDMVDSVNWQTPPIHWKYVFFGISSMCVFLSIVCIALIHSICCSKKKQRDPFEESKKPMLVFKA